MREEVKGEHRPWGAQLICCYFCLALSFSRSPAYVSSIICPRSGTHTYAVLRSWSLLVLYCCIRDFVYYHVKTCCGAFTTHGLCRTTSPSDLSRLIDLSLWNHIYVHFFFRFALYGAICGFVIKGKYCGE